MKCNCLVEINSIKKNKKKLRSLWQVRHTLETICLLRSLWQVRYEHIGNNMFTKKSVAG